MTLIEHIKTTRNAQKSIAFLEKETRNAVLSSLAKALDQSCDAILHENTKDLVAMAQNDPMYDRLLLTKSRIESIANDLENVISLTSPIAKTLDRKNMHNGLLIEKITVPLGVVAVIYESRPNVTVDVFSLCFKTGNACLLKGGKEAYHSNRIFVQIIREVLNTHFINKDVIYLLPPHREETKTLLNATGLVDVCIPRGSQHLINFVRENAKIPVIETGAGIVHIYFDKNGDCAKGRAIVHNAKTRRVSVCNALDCLLIHEECLKDLWSIIDLLPPHNVEIFADDKAYKTLSLSPYPKHLLHHATPEDFGREFLSYKLSIKTVRSIDEALNHIQQYSSGHSEAIITEDDKAANHFLYNVDAAALYVNASTAFTDGGQFGLGAEIGISTQKLHARGPMALEALTSYKWIIRGNGHIRA